MPISKQLPIVGIHEGATNGPVKLMEGIGGCVPIERAFVRQKDNVWFALGEDKSLIESEGVTLLENFEDLELEERQLNGKTIKVPKGGVWTVEGPSQRSDVENANKRKYCREIWEKWIANPKSLAQKAIKERGMLGHLEHPKDGRTDGNLGAMICTEATLRDDGVVWSKFELLDTIPGLIMQEYTRKGVKWGVSSRGTGSVNEKGEVSKEDFQLECWDGVMRPSVDGAYPGLTQSTETGDVRSDVFEDGAGAPDALDPEVVRVMQVVQSLTQTPLDGLDSNARAKLGADIMESAQELLEHAGAADVVRAAFAKLCVLREAGDLSADDAIEAAIQDAQTQDGDADPDYRSVIEDLQRRAQESATEAEELRTQLEEAESRVSTLQEQVDTLSEQLTETQANRDSIASELALAEELLAEMPDRVRDGQVEAAVEAAIEEVPALEEYRGVLSLARADQVEAMAERLLPLVTKVDLPPVVESVQEPVEETPKRNRQSRPTGPGGVVVESEKIGPVVEHKEPRPTSRGAGLAAQMIESAS